MSSFQSQDASNDIPTAPSTSGSLILQNEMLCDNLADSPVACKRLGVLGGSAHQQAPPATCYLQGVADGGSDGPTDFQFVSGYKPVGQTHPNQMFPKVEYVSLPFSVIVHASLNANCLDAPPRSQRKLVSNANGLVVVQRRPSNAITNCNGT
jgi:hypothetical protein